MADTTSTQDTEQAPREFASFLLDINKGRSHAELSEALTELVAEVQRVGKAGSLSYTVKVEPQKGNETVVSVTDQIGRKFPQGERRTSMFFVDGNNNLVRSDPNQHSIFDTPGADQ